MNCVEYNFMMKKTILNLCLSILFLLGCSAAPDPVIFGSEFCNHCAMAIHDHRYGGLILTKKGKSYKFDSLECMLKFESEKLDKSEVVSARYVFNTFKKGELVKLENAFYLRIPSLRSPMGQGIWASDSSLEISNAKNEHGGEVLNWSQLKILLEQK
jgi:copper chaperone NosL